MGYGYGYNPQTGRQMLACDGCGQIGGVRKRKCPHLVFWPSETRGLPYCQAPALCAGCFKQEGGSKAIHAGCEAPAKAAQDQHDADHTRLVNGDAKVSARWGSWHDEVPEGKVGCLYTNAKGGRVKILVDHSEREVDWFLDLTTASPWAPVSV